jgi:hypothetical protein
LGVFFGFFFELNTTRSWDWAFLWGFCVWTLVDWAYFGRFLGVLSRGCSVVLGVFWAFCPMVEPCVGRFLGVLSRGCSMVLGVFWVFCLMVAPCVGRFLGVLSHGHHVVLGVFWSFWAARLVGRGGGWLGVCVGSRRQGWPPRWSGGGGTARSVEAGGAGFEVGPGVGAGPGLVHVCLHRTHSPIMRRGSAALWTFFGCFVSWARCDVGRVLGIWGCRVGWRGEGGLALAWAAGRRGWPPRGHENIAI